MFVKVKRVPKCCNPFSSHETFVALVIPSTTVLSASICTGRSPPIILSRAGERHSLASLTMAAKTEWASGPEATACVR